MNNYMTSINRKLFQKIAFSFKYNGSFLSSDATSRNFVNIIEDEKKSS